MESDDRMTPFISELVFLSYFSVVVPFACFPASCHTEVREDNGYGDLSKAEFWSIKLLTLTEANSKDDLSPSGTISNKHYKLFLFKLLL